MVVDRVLSVKEYRVGELDVTTESYVPFFKWKLLRQVRTWRGSVTVWRNTETGARAGTWTESWLSGVYDKWKWSQIEF